ELARRKQAAALEKQRLEEQTRAEEMRQREFAHAERMKSLEMGLPLPDTGAAARAESASTTAGTVGLLVALAVVGGAIFLSMQIFKIAGDLQVTVFDSVWDLRVALFAALWGMCGPVTFFTVWCTLRTLRVLREPPRPRPQGR